MNTPIYLDYAAATPMDARAMQAMQPFFSEQFYNPSAVYQKAREVRQQLEIARATVASVLGSKDQEIVFTSGGTEANNLAIHGIMQNFPEGNIIVSSIEHESVLEPASCYERRMAPVTKRGIIDIAALEGLIDEKTVLISVMYANNEIGTIQPIKEVADIIQKKRAERHSSLPTHHYPLLFHTDACQAANYLDLHVSRLGIDLMTLNGGKIYATKQSGCLYVRAGVSLRSQIKGGGQESHMRSGTENVGAIIAFATMLQNVQKARKDEGERLQQIRDEIQSIILKNVPNITFNGDVKRRLPNSLHLTVPSADGERLLMELDELGVMVATGSACTASSDRPSHVLLAIGLTEAQASGSLRITLGQPTDQEQAIEATMRIITAIQTHRSLV